MRLAAVALLLPILGACSHISNGSGNKSCAGQFDLGGLGEPLGSSTALYAEMRKALHAGQPIRMDELTRAAGWADGWDTMADVGSNTNEDVLNGIAQTPGYCWSGLPGVKMPVPEGDYLFFKDHVPVQKVHWRGDTLPLTLRVGVSLTPQSELAVSGPRFAPA